jgi:hypothetical protein
VNEHGVDRLPLRIDSFGGVFQIWSLPLKVKVLLLGAGPGL